MSKIDLTAGTAASLFLGGFASIVLVLVWAGFWSGLTLSTLWGWFVAPTFGLPTLSIIQSYGLALAFRCMQGMTNKTTGSDGFAMEVAKGIVLPPLLAGLTLGVGWVAKSWM